MKVVHLLPALEQGGVESVVCDLNRVLVGAGHESVVMSRGGRRVAEIERDGGRHVALELKSKNPLTGLFRARRLRAALAAERPDLVCVHSRVPAWLFVLANRKLGLKWISYAHGANSVSRYSEVMTKGDRVVTPSRFLADYLKANYGTDEARLAVIPNCVDTRRFDPANLDRSVVDALRREWGLRPGDRVTMAVGRISPVKGYDALIRDFAAARANDPARKLVVVGGADRHHLQYLDGLKALAASLGQELHVVFAGPQSHVPECLSLADEVVSANTTKPESFGLSIVEAFAMNKPVRAKRFGGAAEIFAAVEALGAPSLREAVLRLYSFDRFAADTLALYRAVLSGPPA